MAKDKKIKIKIPVPKKRNPILNQNNIAETSRSSAAIPMKDKRPERGGSKNKQDEYLEDSESERLNSDNQKLINEVPTVEEKEDEEEHEYELL